MSEFFSSLEFIVFVCSLVGILLLFLIKKMESGRERRFAEGLRIRADHGALHIKHWLELSEEYLEQAPFFLATVARYGVHIAALSFARLAHSSARQAHALADMVSHKHRFERRETKSQYLREVSEYPIRNSREVISNGAGKNGKSDDDTTVAEH